MDESSKKASANVCLRSHTPFTDLLSTRGQCMSSRKGEKLRERERQKERERVREGEGGGECVRQA